MEEWMVKCKKNFGDLFTKIKYSESKELNATQSHHHYFNEARGKILK
jgi:hypothetical protein